MKRHLLHNLAILLYFLELEEQDMNCFCLYFKYLSFSRNFLASNLNAGLYWMICATIKVTGGVFDETEILTAEVLYQFFQR